MKFNHFFISNFYSPDHCDKIRNSLQYNISTEILDAPAKNVVKTAQVGIVQVGKVKDIVAPLVELVKHVNKENFGFDLYDVSDYDTVNFNEYNANDQGEYGWHNDFPLHFLYHFKLTVLVNLSEEYYEGGQFELFSNGPKTIVEFNEPGSIIIFPSWVSHRVTPVTSGTRKTMALFLTGPKIK